MSSHTRIRASAAQHPILWCWRFKIHEGHFGYFLGRPFSLLHVEKSVVEMDCIDASCINKWPKRKRITFVERSHKIEFYKCIYYYFHTVFDFDNFVLTFLLTLYLFHCKSFQNSISKRYARGPSPKKLLKTIFLKKLYENKFIKKQTLCISFLFIYAGDTFHHPKLILCRRTKYR